MSDCLFDRIVTPVLMGVVNVTPNSFSDGGQFMATGDAVARVRQLAAATGGGGTGMVDIGAEASSFFCAGVTAVSAEEQLARLLPVLAGLRDLDASIVISVDTRSGQVARGALAAGAKIINDISAGTHDDEMLPVVAEAGAGIILMHMGAGYPATPPHDDADAVASVRDYLEKRVAAARAAGVRRGNIAIDPGIGFGKTMADNWRLAAGCGTLAEVGVPVVIGASRKRFLETPRPAGIFEDWDAVLAPLAAAARDMPDVHPRDAATAALTRLTAARGAAIHRVHHVTLAKRALTM